MNIKAHHKYIKVTPKKLRFVVKSIKSLKPTVAMAKLQLSNSRGAKMLYKAIKSAVDNGVALHKVNADTLKFAELKIDEGIVLKRIRPGARGMARPYKRRTSHITVVLTEDNSAKPQSRAPELKETSSNLKVEALKEDMEKIEKSKKVTKKTK